MKQLILFSALFFLFLKRGAAQNFIIEKDPKHHNNLYKGFITDSLLKADTSCKWFGEAQRVYQPKPAVVAALAKESDSIHFLIFMGTWCEDSHFIVPRFYKILEAAKYDKTKVALVAVDRNKKDMAGLPQVFNITNVPSILVFKAGKEIGRVVEYGTSGRFDEELAAIISGK